MSVRWRGMVASRRVGLTMLGLLAVVLMGLVSPVPAVGATPDLSITSDARYLVQPEKGRVHVVVDLALTNHLKDTKTKRFFFDEVLLDVIPRASGFTLTRDGSGVGSVKATKHTDDYTRLRIRFPKLFSGKTATYRLAFDLRDPGGSPGRDLRVGDSLVSFPVWAYATDSTPGSRVRVEFPAGYDVEVEAGSITDPMVAPDGRTFFDTGRLARPLSFFAYLVAARPGAYEETPVEPTVLGAPASLIVRGWPDDPAWTKRVVDLTAAALPVLGERIGLAWPHPEPLTIQEAVSRSAEGYAGLYDPGKRLIDVAYYAGSPVVLHELAHGWFNGALLADRWADEGFASYYASAVAPAVDVSVREPAMADELAASRIALNDWGPVGEETPAVEAYGYAASEILATAIAKRAGADRLRAVWDDAADGTGAYQPARGPVERVDGPPDWRGLLDLLEARTGTSYDDLWRAWVARPADLALLDARSGARVRYEEVVTLAGPWQLPRPIRDALRAWQFDTATAMLDEAAAILDSRATIADEAARAGLIVPDRLRQAFQDDDGFDDARAEADAELAAVRAYAAAGALRPTTTDPLRDLGLVGETPEADLVAARDAFAAGDLEASVAASSEAGASWAHAASVGGGRALSIALLILAAILAIFLVVGVVRRRGARRRRRPMATRMSAPHD